MRLSTMSSELKKRSADDFDDESYEYDDQYEQYRTLSISAVTALIFGVLSLLVVPVLSVFGAILVLPLMGTILGLFAVWTVYSRPEEFTGRRIAATGLGLSAVMLLLGGVLNYQLNNIQVPAAYKDKQVYFWELQPQEEIDLPFLMQMRGRDVELPLPERAKSLDGQKVFITGYVYPGSEERSEKVCPRAGQGNLLFRRAAETDRHDRGHAGRPVAGRLFLLEAGCGRHVEGPFRVTIPRPTHRRGLRAASRLSLRRPRPNRQRRLVAA